jgi:hypothetical protein
MRQRAICTLLLILVGLILLGLVLVGQQLIERRAKEIGGWRGRCQEHSLLVCVIR